MNKKLWFVPVLLSLFVFLCPPVMADIIQPTRFDNETPSETSPLQNQLHNLGISETISPSLSREDMAYFSGEPERVQAVAGLTFSEAIVGMLMMGAGTALALMWGHQLSK